MIVIHVQMFQHAFALESLKDHLIEGERALDVGSGSGYLTACIALMLGKNDKTIGVEHIPELAQESIANIGKGNKDLLDSERIVIKGEQEFINR